MTIRLEKLYKHARQNYQMELIAGEGGLTNIINWVHMIEDEQVASFLRGNELVFTTGIGHPDNAWLNGFAEGLIGNKASGLVVNIGPYIKEVPESVIEYCRQNEFPLFAIPWHVRLVDITRDFCRRIINGEQAEMSVSSTLKNVIFFPEELASNQAQLERRGFNVAWRYCVAVLNIDSVHDAKHKENVAAFRLFAENIVNRFSEKYSIFTHENRLTIVFAKFEDGDIISCINGIMDYYLANRKNYTLHVGIGQNESGLVNVSKSYKQAAAVLHMAIKNNWHKVYYKDLGIYKILLSTEDDNLLREIHHDILGRLVEYDVTHNTDYMNTLKCYLENDASIQAVAKLTFVHRNTINYKLNKIKEITGYDISSIEERLKIMLAFKIRDIL